ncbi:MAG: hypothetical protein WCP18_01490 [bacterium]
MIYNSFKKYFLFVIRQFYRLIIIAPWVGLMEIIGFFVRSMIIFNEVKKPFFLVTSTIYPIDKKLSYANSRSIFISADRIRQTIETIKSIRKNFPQAYILVADNGTKDEGMEDIKLLVDKFVFLGNKSIIRFSADHLNKSFGELVLCLAAIKFIPTEVDYFFKISGRYFLNKNFNFEKWPKDDFVFLKVRIDFYSSRLYGFPMAFLDFWRLTLLKGLPLALIGYPIENLLCKYVVKNKIAFISMLGVGGRDATTGSEINE